MNERLFDQVQQRAGPATEHETTFQFLAREGRPETVEIRQWMEKWFQDFPTDHRSELKTRLESKHDHQFMGAYFELQIFAMLRLLKCHVDVHPHFEEAKGTVDFCATRGTERFYLEATVCGFGRGTLHSNPNEEDAVHKIRSAFSHLHSDVWLDATGELRKTLGTPRLINPINKLLGSYSPDDVRRQNVESWPLRPPPRISIIEKGWRLDVHLRPPIASDGRGQILGPSRGGPVDGSSPLVEALSEKVEDWREKGLDQEKFLIAVNICHSEFSDTTDIMPALYHDLDEHGNGREFRRDLRRVTGVIALSHSVLGAEIGTAVRMFRNGDANIPDCLRFLLEERKLGSLIGMSR